MLLVSARVYCNLAVTELAPHIGALKLPAKTMSSEKPDSANCSNVDAVVFLRRPHLRGGCLFVRTPERTITPSPTWNGSHYPKSDARHYAASSPANAIEHAAAIIVS